MKFKNIIYLAILFIASIANAQNDTLYMYKDGKATLISAVAGIDSMVVKNSKLELKVGQPYQGGIVAYLLKSGDQGYDATVTNGFIVAGMDQSNGIKWSNNSDSYINTNAYIGWGKSNTNKIVTNQGVGTYAASICNDLFLNGYDDWYLPSIYELYEIANNNFLLSNSGLSTNSYWSSTDLNINSVNIKDLSGTLAMGNKTKSDLCSVRAIRTITNNPSLPIPNSIYFYRNGVVIHSFETDKIDSLSFQKANELLVGQKYKGGIIAYIFKPGDYGYVDGEVHGIIAAPNDQSTSIGWNKGYLSTPANESVIGKGGLNTINLVPQLTIGNYAAFLCNDLVLNGYDDWCLPSKDEVIALYFNRYDIGNFSTNSYWSSSYGRGGYGAVYAFSFYSGSGAYSKVDYLYNVRAIRYF